MRHLFWSILFVVSGCGGTTSQQPGQSPGETEAVDNIAGEQLSPQIQEDESMDHSLSQGPASITLNVIVNDKPASSKIKLVNQADEVIAEGNSGQTFRIRSGRYTAHIKITDAGTMVDKPTKVQEFEVAPGSEITETVTFPWARIRLNVKVKGQLSRKATVKLMRDGEVVATLESAARDYVIISPGHYQAEVKVGSMVTTLDDIMIPEGATRDVPINVSF